MKNILENFVIKRLLENLFLIFLWSKNKVRSALALRTCVIGHETQSVDTAIAKY